MNPKPTGVLVVSILHLIISIPWIAGMLWLLMLTSDTARVSSMVGADLAKYLLPGVLLLAAGAAGNLATAWGLWNLRQWGQATAIALSGIVLFIQIVGLISLQGSPFATGNVIGPALAYAAAAVGIIMYLLQPNVRALFTGESMGAGPWPLPSSSCPHCGAVGIMVGMIACPWCRMSLVAPPPTPISTGSATSASRPKPTKVGEPFAEGQAWLSIQAGPDAGRRFELDEDSQIGRERDCVVRLSEDDHVSRRHARVQREQGHYFIQDIGSASGTFVNRNEVRSRRLLYDGDVITVGETTLVFKSIGR